MSTEILPAATAKLSSLELAVIRDRAFRGRASAGDAVKLAEYIGVQLEHGAKLLAERDALWVLLLDAEKALVDLNACDNPTCPEPNCSHILARIDAAVDEYRGGER